MKRNFNELFSAYPKGVFKMIKKARAKYCKRKANNQRYEDFMMAQGFEISQASFKIRGSEEFEMGFDVISYEYFADQLIPKYIMNIISKETWKEVEITIYSTVSDDADE